MIDKRAGVKHRAIVSKVNDPKELGRVKVKIAGFDYGHDETAWCYPCASLAGSGYGVFMLPRVGDEVWVELDASGQTWIYTGFYWSGRKTKPSDGAAEVRVIKTPGGHLLKFDDAGDVELSHEAGAKIVLKSNGDVVINGGSYGVVTEDSICPFTASPHKQGCGSVLAPGRI
jgi:Type VI secretion system/phage-baseplate injector OB domain